MDARRWWTRIVDAVTVVWLCAFLLVVGATYGLVSARSGVLSAADRLLWWLVPVFVLDVGLLYWWSEEDVRTFARHNSLLVLTAVPWLRPLRVIRAGRGLRAIGVLARSRRAGNAVNKLRRLGRRLVEACRRSERSSDRDDE